MFYLKISWFHNFIFCISRQVCCEVRRILLSADDRYHETGRTSVFHGQSLQASWTVYISVVLTQVLYKLWPGRGHRHRKFVVFSFLMCSPTGKSMYQCKELLVVHGHSLLYTLVVRALQLQWWHNGQRELHIHIL